MNDEHKMQDSGYLWGEEEIPDLRGEQKRLKSDGQCSNSYT